MARLAFNKLIRDKITDDLITQGKQYVVRQAEGDEFRQLLLVKLYEEVDEIVEAQTKEDVLDELADLREVIDWLAWTHGFEPGDVTCRQLTKKLSHGGFANRVVLVEVSVS